MEKNLISQGQIIIAWATPVSLAQLGARLEAYVTTKARITTFRLAARDTTLAACRNPPEEIKLMIASEVRNIVFTRKIEKWTKISECLAGTCTTLSHTNQADLYSMHSFLSEILEDEELIKEELEAEIEHDAAEEHQKIIFTRDFGIRPYFMMSKSYDYSEYSDDDDFETDDVQAQAFLTLPVFVGPILSESAPNRVYISTHKTMSPSALSGLSEAQVQQFRIALSTLNLQPYDPDEKAGKVEEWPQLTMLGFGKFKPL